MLRYGVIIAICSSYIRRYKLPNMHKCLSITHFNSYTIAFDDAWNQNVLRTVCGSKSECSSRYKLPNMHKSLSITHFNSYMIAFDDAWNQNVLRTVCGSKSECSSDSLQFNEVVTYPQNSVPLFA